MHPNLKEFGTLIKEQRRALDISQEELAHRSGLDRTYISGLERGNRNPSLRALLKLANGLNTSLSQMLNGFPSVSNRNFSDDV
jgi:transcriptional regulator with XRE-family HTH domain